MPNFQRLTIAARSFAKVNRDVSRSGSTCVFCKHCPQPFRSPQPRRLISVSNVVATREEKEPRAVAAALESPVSQESNQHEFESEFEFDVQPDDQISPAPGTTRTLRSAKKGRRPVGKKRRGDRKAVHEMQERIEKIVEVIKTNPRAAKYEPAESWDQLQNIGGEEVRDVVEDFRGFLSTSRIKGQVSITAAVYRTVVETLTTMAAGGDPNVTIRYKASGVLSAARHVLRTMIMTTDGGPQDTIQMSYPSREIEEAVLSAAIHGVHKKENATTSVTNKDIEEHIKAWGRQWLHLSLEDPVFKLAIIKRLTRLLGRTIPDHAIHSSNTVFILLSHIAQPDAPKTVFASLQAHHKPTLDLRGQKLAQNPQRRLLDLKNVNITNRRQTYVDKEESLGRWKVVENELRERGLPVLSSKVRIENTPAL